MKRTFRLTARAKAEVLDIYLYGMERFGPNQADRYLDALEHCFDTISVYPRIGRLASALGAGVRRHEHGSHVILYREERDGVLILAVVHGSSTHGLEL